MLNKIYNYFIICFLLSSFVACNSSIEEVKEQKVAINVSAEQVKKNDINQYLVFNGVTIYQKKEMIRSNVTGYISRMKFKVGDFIGNGQTFATIRSKEQDALREAGRADSSLMKFITPLFVKCNSSGNITLLNITENDYVAEGDILATVSQTKSLVVQVNVPYEYVDFVKIGTPCQIFLQNNKVINSRISGVLSTIDPVSQSQVFVIALPAENLPENLNVQVKVLYKQAKSVISVPKNALQTNELLTEFWVMKVENDSIAKKVNVMTLVENDSLVQVISSELKINDWIITEGAYQMQDSTYVKIKNGK